MYKKINLALYTIFFWSVLGWSQNIAPTLTATGNQPYCSLSQINIVTDFDIVDPDDTETEALYIQISTGYEQGEDVLTLLGSHPSISSSWNIIEGKLTLSGATSTFVSYVDLIAAAKDVVFQSSNENPSDKTFSITIGDANYLPSTGHYYEYVPSVGITWTSARTAAENRTYFGLKGYLATITSAEEAQLSGEQAAGAGWIGGSDEETEGVWKWVTGPEAGTVFWNGNFNGSTPNFAFWNNGEPNQTGNEDYAHITFNVGIKGSWNDLPNEGGVNDYYPQGFMVEYGGTSGDPTLNISTSTSIYTTSIINTNTANICESGSVTIEATASLGDVLWFDASTGGTQLGNGQNFTTPILNTTTTYYALASINGCLEGERVPVTVIVTPLPTINSISEDLVCNSGSGTLSATTSEGVINWYTVSSGGASIFSGPTFITPIVNTTTTYYVDAIVNGCISSTRTPVTLTVQKTNIPTTTNSNQNFCDIEQATISDIAITGQNILWYNLSTGGTPLNTSNLLSTSTYYASQTINGCESLDRLPVNITIYETVVLPDASNVPDLFECDNMLDGDDTNGYSIFNLTTNETILLNGKLASDFTFEYFTDVAYTTPISTAVNAYENTIIDNQTIYVRIVNNADNTCFTDTSFGIHVNQLPTIQSSIIFKNCDEDGTVDGFTDFNLTEANTVISNNISDLTFRYYNSYNDADTSINEIASIFNNQTANTVYARVENANGCHRVSTINLQVSTTSFPQGYIQELETCDDDNDIDGLHVFDLSQASSAFLAQFPSGQNLNVHYFENLDDARLEQNEILQQDNYINTNAFSQILYVRVESDDNGECFGIGPHLVLTVHPRPEFEVDNSEIYCLDNNPITLTTFNPKGNYTYEWKDSNGQIISNLDYAEVVSGGAYTVVATSNFNCESFPVVFTVVESAIADINIDDITIIELSDNNSITINNDNNNLGIGNYEFALDDVDGSYKNQPYFDNVGAGEHIIYVKDKNGCGIASLEVFILGFPKFFTPNDDGTNDTWQIRGLGTDFTNASKVSVYNRYGKLIKQLNAKNGTWDGTFNGQQLPDSDYWFIAELIESTGEIITYKGHFSLIR